MTLSERLKGERKKAGLSQKEFAEKLGLNARTYASYERGERDISTALLLNICKALNISSDRLLGNQAYTVNQEPSGASSISNTAPFTPDQMIPIPVIGRVAAGYTCLAEQYIESYALADPESLTDGYDHFWLRVTGDSMEPDIRDGDLVLVRAQETVESGDCAVVIVDEEDGLVKNIEFGNGYVSLISKNPNYPPRVFVHEDANRVRIVGKVIELKRMM